MKLTPTKPLQPDLITRYNLSAKIAKSSPEAQTESSPSNGSAKVGGKQAWSQNKGERQALLQRRREEMILSARKKMEAKVAAEQVMGDSGLISEQG